MCASAYLLLEALSTCANQVVFGKKGVVVVGGSVDTMLSEMVGRNTDEVSASKLTSSSSSEL